MLNLICDKLCIVIGEEWLGDNGKTYMINNFGALWEVENPNLSGKDIQSNWMLLLTGKLKPLWKPNKGAMYYVPEIQSSDVDDRYVMASWNGGYTDIHRLTNNMVFSTKEGAIEAANEMLKLWKGR